MKIKKIRARSFKEALAVVRKEFGEDALILSSEDKKDGKVYVEVTAAIDQDIEIVDNSHVSHPQLDVSSDHVIEMKSEIQNLRKHIEAMRNTGFELNLAREKKEMFHFLREKSIKEEYALKIIERANAIEDIESVLHEDLEASGAEDASFDVRGVSDKSTRRIIMLIGPTGVGKTTTIAKLASMAIRERSKVALISFDTFKIGAAEQIRIYSRMIGIPLDIVSDRESFAQSIQRFSDRDLILVDTSGHNPKDQEYVNGLKNIYETDIPIETQLLLSASSDCDFLMDTYNYYKAVPINSMAFTKADEAVRMGSIYNLCKLYGKPVRYITTGQKVPGNIEFVDSEKLTNLILSTGSA
jgi:flagellar biosynthesis protein FlhF